MTGAPASPLAARAWRALPARPALRPRLGGLRRRLRPHLLLALPILLAAAALGFGLSAWRLAEADRRIGALAAGQDIAVDPEAAPELVLARIGFLATRERIAETEPLVEALDRRAPGLAARARYRVANARMRRALALLTANDLDRAGPLVTLARQDYRRALRDRPEDWDAKFNLDVASRLVRDFPEFDRQDGDELQAEPKKIWTDIPGQPRGGP
ncbi:MxaK protein [Methylobacterium sp. A54F]